MRQGKGPNIHLHIERLILDGLPVDRLQAPHVQMAIESELARLLAEHGLDTNQNETVALPSLRADPIQLTPSYSPTQIGRQIAKAVYSGIENKR